MIPVAKPHMTEKDAQAVADAVLSGWILQGPKVEEFEHALAAYIGTKFAVAVSSCTTAMHLGFIAAGIRPGDEIIVPSFSYIASANSIMHAGGVPVFADINVATYNMDPADVERKISKKTVGILAVHQIGLPCDLPALSRIANKYRLKLFEDAACGLGSRIAPTHVGTTGVWGAFSFHPRKAITTAEGGLIVTDDPEIAASVRMLRAHGASVDVKKRHTSKKILKETFPVVGYNFRMSDIHAALGVSQFARISYFLSERTRIAEAYTRAFQDIDTIIIPHVPDGYTHTFQSYMIRLKGNHPVKHPESLRNTVMQKMLNHGIATRAGVMASHLEAPYKTMYPDLILPVTEKVADDSLILPSYPGMTHTDQQQVISRLINILKSV